MGSIRDCSNCKYNKIDWDRSPCNICLLNPSFRDKWELRKPEPPKIMRRMFMIEYKNDLNVSILIKHLDNEILTDVITSIEMVPEDYGKNGFALFNETMDKLYPQKSEEPEIVKNCENCGWWNGYYCNNSNRCILYSGWKPKESEIEKYCETCGRIFKEGEIRHTVKGKKICEYCYLEKLSQHSKKEND